MSADVVIGAATAFHLSLLGAGDVLVLDRATVASGMSSRSSALVRMHYTFGPDDHHVRTHCPAFLAGASCPACGRRRCRRRSASTRRAAL